MNKIPIVSKEIGFAICAELEQTTANHYITDILNKLEKENPIVAEFISKMSMQHSDPVALCTIALLTYRLIESQLEANELNAIFRSEATNE